MVRCEASIWSRLEHPNILPLLGIFWLESPLDDAGAGPALVSVWQETGDIMRYLEMCSVSAGTECDLYKRKLELVRLFMSFNITSDTHCR